MADPPRERGELRRRGPTRVRHGAARGSTNRQDPEAKETTQSWQDEDQDEALAEASVTGLAAGPRNSGTRRASYKRRRRGGHDDMPRIGREGSRERRPASQVLAELGFNVLRERRAVGLACMREERLEVLALERVQHRLCWTARPIRRCEGGQGALRRARPMPGRAPVGSVTWRRDRWPRPDRAGSRASRA